MAWYTLQTNPNYEKKVIEMIEFRKREKNIHSIREIFSPEEIIMDVKDGKKRERKKRLYSNYLFIEMDYSDEVWHALKGIKGVVKFIGDRDRPTMVPEKEISIMKARVSGETPKPKVAFALESNVRINSGSFMDFNGIIKGVDYEKNKAKVAINIFNRETLVDLELTAIEVLKE